MKPEKRKVYKWTVHVTFGIFSLLLMFVSCYKDNGDYTGDCRDIHFNDGLYEDGKEDPGTIIVSHYIETNCLFVTVQYGGGCMEHDIQMAANGWIKTNPPQVDARLIHDNQDLCDALITEELSFDLLSVKYDNSSEIVVNLKGLDEQINHTYIE